MAVEYTLEQRANRAQALLNDVMFIEALDAVQAAYVLQFRRCAQNDDRGRLRYQDALNDLDAVKAHLLAVITQGELEAKRAQEFQTPNAMQKLARIF